jgi:hypothetical protein
MPTDRASLNRAFWDLGLRFQWDEKVWATLMGLPDLRSQLAYYLERHQPHLLSVYDVDFLKGIIEARLMGPAGEQRIGLEAGRSY